MTASNQVFSAFSFLAFFGVLVPLPAQLRNKNIAVLCYMFWTGLACFKFFVDSIIWNDNAINWAPVWCDISTRIHIAAQVGIPAASLRINSRLFSIVVMRNPVGKPSWAMTIYEIFIGIGLGLLAIPLQYVVQGHRFNIFEDVGCYPVTVNRVPSLIIVFGIPLLLSIGSLFYSGFTIVHIIQHRRDVASVVEKANARNDQYYRLLALAGTEALFGLPLSLYVLCSNIIAGTKPYVSWASVHKGFSRVDQFPAILWRATRRGESDIEMSRWLFVVCGILFAGLFITSEDTKRFYANWFASLRKRVVGSTSSSFTGHRFLFFHHP
ncbi:STE3-like pheromone receptor [Flagelloscypha sp. PMI_526]|nr:STE3-like pheromone receptor [Flagelloscypha sp. PMI_526]